MGKKLSFSFVILLLFVKENISFHSLIDISLQILLIPFFEDTLSFLYNLNKDILSVFHLNIQVYANLLV
jgi:hypothetical protein